MMSDPVERALTQRADFEAALAAGDWTKILNLGESDGFLLKYHDQLNAFILAAFEKSDVIAIERAAEAATQCKWGQRQKYLFARTFVASGRSDLAWNLIRNFGENGSDHTFMKQALRIKKFTKDNKLRQEIQDLIDDHRRGGKDVEAKISKFSFAAPCCDPTPLGTAIACASARTSPRHLVAFDHAMKSAQSSLRRGRRPTLIEYENVFVDRHGQIWCEDGAIIKSSGKPIFNCDSEDVPNFEVAFYAIKETRGLYHWLVDRVTHFAWMTEEGCRTVPILLSDRGPPFEVQTLEMIDLIKQSHKVGQAAFVKRLIVPLVGFGGMMYWDQVSSCYDQLKMFANEMADLFSVVPAEHVYISRSDSKRRPLSNEKEIEAKLAANGYEIVSFTGMPLWRQFFISSSAREIVAPHGAGLSHLVMCNPGTNVVEIIPVSDGTHTLRFNYARLSLVRGHNYRAWLEPQIGKENSWSVDTEAFFDFLRACPITPDGG